MPSSARSTSAGAGETGKERSETSSQQPEPAEGGVDIQVLAEKIYRLLKEEARLERQRLGIRRGR